MGNVCREQRRVAWQWTSVLSHRISDHSELFCKVPSSSAGTLPAPDAPHSTLNTQRHTRALLLTWKCAAWHRGKTACQSAPENSIVLLLCRVAGSVRSACQVRKVHCYQCVVRRAEGWVIQSLASPLWIHFPESLVDSGSHSYRHLGNAIFNNCQQGMVAQACNPGSWEAEAEELRPVWAIWKYFILRK